MFLGLTPSSRLGIALIVCLLHSLVPKAANPDEGIRHFENGKYDSAVFVFQEALRQDPGNSNLRYNLALSWFESGNVKDALPELQAYLEQNGKDPAARMNFGLMLFSTAEYDKAGDQFSQLFEDEYWSPMAYCYTGLCNYAMGDYKNALQNLEACEVDSAFNLKLHGLKANAALILENLELAEDYFNKAILEDPEYSPYYLNRGIAHFKQDNFEKAHADFTVCIALTPGQKKAYEYRGYCEEALGNDREALANFEKAGITRRDIENRINKSSFLAKHWYYLVIATLLIVLLIVVLLHRGK